MKKSKCFLVLFTLILVFVKNVNAGEVDWLFGIGMDLGGEKLGTLEWDNGSSKDIRTHQGIHITLGLDYILNDNFIIRGDIGYKGDSAGGKEGDVKFTRLPIELIPFAVLGSHRFGAGGVYHFNSEYSCDISNSCDFNVEIENSFGWVVQYEYKFLISTYNQNFAFGIRYLNINYTPKLAGATLSGSGVGFRLTALF